VICIKRGEKISDEASIMFTRAFYHALFSQTVSVCQAFKIAKTSLKSERDKRLANEAMKFVLFTNDGGKKQHNSEDMMMQMYGIHDKHTCNVFGPFKKGQVEDISPKPMFRFNSSKIQDFIGRGREMQQTLEGIYDSRLVTIKGLPGIGKTSMAQAVSYFLDERLAFRDGIIYLTLRGLESTTMCQSRLF
jgi:hypothetical protein